MVVDASNLSLDEIESIEKLTLRWLVQATVDFGFDAYDVFYYSPDSDNLRRATRTRFSSHRLPRCCVVSL